MLIQQTCAGGQEGRWVKGSTYHFGCLVMSEGTFGAIWTRACQEELGTVQSVVHGALDKGA